MSEEETSAENEEDLWAAATDDLAQQKEMLRAAAQGGAKDAGGAQEQPAEQAAAVSTAEPAPEQPPPPATSPGIPQDVDRILDIPLQISVELGRARMLINDLLQLGQGSVIELAKLVGEPLEVTINDQLVAKGEVVVVNEKFGVRITEITSPKERIKSMG